MGDEGKTAGSFCRHLKSDNCILFLALLEEAQVKLGKIAAHDGVIDEFLPSEVLNIEKMFRKIMGKVSAYKNLSKYISEYGTGNLLQEPDIQFLDNKLISLGAKLNKMQVQMNWINYSSLSNRALLFAEFTTTLRTAECVFFKFLNEEGSDTDFSYEARYINRLSKVTHLGMVLQDIQDI